ncbi:hypothetical protein B0I35DRAFT_355028 [Stachybotrys elegans]|uniref:Ankyrin 2,3/unc44 n=1 Tax=Stachybotrys elegans TaxID=80388 RepID=A0A8K0SP48_9HYPO|nr:hypothetical protein B0I35DRAFT_355028 [Stachybotrys elegans]
MSDDELARVIADNRRPDGSYHIDIAGLEDVSQDQRAALAKRLQTQKQALDEDPQTASCPLDLDLVNARLLEVSQCIKSHCSVDEQEALRRTRSPTIPIDLEEEARRDERHAYHQLINDGGRPLYSIDLLEDVLSRPADFDDLLKPWHLVGSNERRKAFSSQLERWESFREWQHDNRGIEEDEERYFPEYIDQRRTFFERQGAGKWFAGLDSASLRDLWEGELERRSWRRSWCKEPDGTTFTSYCQSVKRRLSRHGVKRSLSLRKSPRHQDRLMTWLEYLNFEYWWFDRFNEPYEKLKPDNDQAWQKLLGLDLLKSHETEDYCHSVLSAFQHDREEEEAVKQVEDLMEEAREVWDLTHKHPEHYDTDERIDMKVCATERLQTAQKRLHHIRRRNKEVANYVQATRDYHDAKKNVVRHRLLVEWVLGQILVIEAEMKKDDARISKSRQMKRRLPEVCDPGGDSTSRVLKRRKSGNSEAEGFGGALKGDDLEGQRRSLRLLRQQVTSRPPYQHSSIDRLTAKSGEVFIGQSKALKSVVRKNSALPTF